MVFAFLFCRGPFVDDDPYQEVISAKTDAWNAFPQLQRPVLAGLKFDFRPLIKVMTMV